MTSESLQIGVLASALSADPRQAPRLARAMGFTGLQFDAYTSALNIPDLSGSGRREFRLMLTSQDQRLSSLRADLGAKGFGPGADVDRLLSQLDRAMEAAAGLAAPLVCVDLGPLPAPPVESKPKPKVTPGMAGLILLPTMAAAAEPEQEAPARAPDPALVSQVDAALADLGRRADRYSVTVALRSDLASFAALERALRQADCPWFGVDFDPSAILRDEWASDEVFSRLGGLVRHVRGRDAVAGADRRTRSTRVGAGDVDWGQLLSDLDASGYRGWITIDPTELTDRAAAAEAGLKFLLKLML